MASWGVGRLDLFVVGSDSSLYQNTFSNNQWGGYSDIGSRISWIYDPMVISRQTNNYDAFVVGNNHAVTHRHWDGTQWIDEPLGGSALSPPAVTSRDDGSIDIFIVDADHTIWHNELAGGSSTWSGFVSFGRTADNQLFQSHQPAAVSCSTDHMQVVAVAGDSGLQTKRWTSQGGWSPWQRVDSGGLYTTGPAAVCGRAPNTIDMLMIGYDSSMYILTSDNAGVAWNPRTNLGGSWAYRPTVISVSQGVLDVFVVGLAQSAVTNYRFNGKWSNTVVWHDILRKAPTAVSWGPGRLDLFVIGADYGVYQRTSPGDGTWSPTIDVNENYLGGLSVSKVGGGQ